MNDIASDRVGPMVNPPHLGELIRESMDDVGWNVTETAARLGCERGTLSRLLNGRAGVSANMALALEDIGWGTAEHWLRMQAAYELARARRERVVAERGAGATARISVVAPARPDRVLSWRLSIIRFQPTEGRSVRGSKRTARPDSPVVERGSRPRRRFRRNPEGCSLQKG